MTMETEPPSETFAYEQKRAAITMTRDAAAEGKTMTDEQIKTIVNRFLAWELPSDFNPDAGISFKRFGNEGTPRQYEMQPSGTNLLDAHQAEDMIRHILDLPVRAESGEEATGVPVAWRWCRIGPEDYPFTYGQRKPDISTDYYFVEPLYIKSTKP